MSNLLFSFNILNLFDLLKTDYQYNTEKEYLAMNEERIEI